MAGILKKWACQRGKKCRTKSIHCFSAGRHARGRAGLFLCIKNMLTRRGRQPQ